MNMETENMEATKIIGPAIVSRTHLIGVVPTIARPMGHHRSLPSEVGSTLPDLTVRSPHPAEHPYPMSGVVEVGVRPLEPGNASTLVTEYPPEWPAAQPEGLEE